MAGQKQEGREHSLSRQECYKYASSVIDDPCEYP